MSSQGRVDVSPDLLDQLSNHSGAFGVVVFDADSDRALSGLRHALAELARLRHPEEPTEPLVRFAYPPTLLGGGAGTWLDVADIEASSVPAAFVETFRTALEEQGVVGTLSPVAASDVEAAAAQNIDNWSGEEIPPWLPLPADLAEVRANFFDGAGFVDFWRDGPSRVAALQYANLVAAEGFEVTDLVEIVVPDKRQIWSFEFADDRRNFDVKSGNVERRSEAGRGTEVRLRVRVHPRFS